MHVPALAPVNPPGADPWQLAALKTREAASAWWHALTRPRMPSRAPVAFPDHLDAATLKDIGAPDWMVSRALEERDLQRQHLLGLRQWRGG